VGIVDVAPETMRAGLIEMADFARATEPLERFEDFLERAMRFMPHRSEAHLRYSLTHSLKRTADGHYTWKQDQRPRPMVARSPGEQEADRQRLAEALWRDVHAVRCPALLFRGAQSKILAHDVAERMVKEMRDGHLVVIPRATHNVHSDNPADFAYALDAFLSDALRRAL
jgi:pimeloyl-ACP methyl ester carboxylesterase